MAPKTPLAGARYNAAEDLIGRNLAAGRGDKPAFIDKDGPHSYAELDARANRVANLLTARGVRIDERVLMCMTDTIDFPAVFLGAIKAGIVPIPVNTRLTPKDYAFMLADSRARALVVSEALLPQFLDHIGEHPYLETVIVAGADGRGYALLSDALADQPERFETAPTRADDICFWLYTSGTTGKPKGAVHLHSHLAKTAELYAIPVLGIREDDVVFSAAKLFFAYGLGNGLTFPMAVGATTVLLEGPPEPKAVAEVLKTQDVTIFYGVPTLYGMLLASGELPAPGAHKMRAATSAGEALPAELFRRFKETTGVEILDGLGSTEMLHIFLSNRPDDIRPGTSGKPVPGYDLRLVDDDGRVIEEADALGMLEVNGPTSAILYWGQRDKSRETFCGPWTRTGDKYVRDADGYYTHAGRADDMMKVGGIYVSPVEVESAILQHAAVLECAVVGHPDKDDLIKPKAFIVLRTEIAASDALADEIKGFVKETLAGYKYPRWVEFADELPKTATGKIQRFKLRATGGA
ncbi:MAG: benzoate-CoA ligase family protein [Alphaproteobacteria bacterium]|nr:benzoate-CoA ligase family protein [Alphaproteobacteria bacterium]